MKKVYSFGFRKNFDISNNSEDTGQNIKVSTNEVQCCYKLKQDKLLLNKLKQNK
jgi:hypothetical protein